MSARFARYVVSTLALASAAAVHASPVAVDGVLGSEWDGVNAVVVAHDANPSFDFQHPGTTNEGSGYSVLMRGDAQYLYVALQSNGDSLGQNWANLYFNTDLAGGSDWGIEVKNNRAFQPGVAGYFDMTNYLTEADSASNIDHVIELAISWDYFTSNPNGFLPAGTDVDQGVQLRLSQSFGYAVAGGDIDGGTRFGTVARAAANNVPEPSGIALTLAALGAAALVRRKAAKKA